MTPYDKIIIVKAFEFVFAVWLFCYALGSLLRSRNEDRDEDLD